MTAARRPEPPWAVLLGTAVAYAAIGWPALALALPPGYATPLFPSAGLALVAVAVWGRPAVVGTALGSFLVNVMLGASRGHEADLAALLLPAVIGCGAAAQALLGAVLLRRFVGWPTTLDMPREIATAGLCCGVIACTVSPSVATAALAASGAIATADAAGNWAIWWVGDTLGVLVGAPLALTLVGLPRADWAPRRRTVALPLLLATALLGAATAVVARWDRERLQSAFDHEAGELAGRIESRLEQPLHALQAVHGAWLAAGGLDGPALRDASAWWLGQPLGLQAAGVALAVARDELPRFVAAARAGDRPGYRVFEREAAAAADPAQVLAMRWIEPPGANEAALGVDIWTVPGARDAAAAARDGGEAVATRAFTLTQAVAGGRGLVMYRAVYRDWRDGLPATPRERRERFAGVAFVTVALEPLFAGIGGAPAAALRWCLLDGDDRLAGAPGCRAMEPGRPGATRALLRDTGFGGRTLRLQVEPMPGNAPGGGHANVWLFAVSGTLAVALLGTLLLVVTGRTRRTERAVAERTAELSKQVQERTQAEAALHASEARLRGILDNVPIGVMFLDATGRIVETNPRLAELLGRGDEELRATTLAALTHPDERRQSQALVDGLLAGRDAAGLAARRRTSLHTVRLLRGDGEPLAVRVHVAVLADAEGQAPRLACAVEDITERARLEASERALHRAEAASRAKSEFVSRMSHELRTPLNAILGFTQLLGLDREPALAAHQREWAAQIQQAGWHLLEMINDTLDLARIESGAVQLATRPVALGPVVAASQALVSLAASQRGVRLDSRLGPGAAAVRADETRLKQVLTNLLSNAVKYNQAGGAVHVSAQRVADGRVRIEVSDTGIGMTAAQLEALFQPYNRLGREDGPIEGTGLGLVISRRLAELMGGALSARSVSGAGTVFTLDLAAADDGAPPSPAPAGPQAPDGASSHARRVHCVEDNETNVIVMRGILAQRPHIRLDVSGAGLDALQAIRARRPDLILLDMHLPDISGLELLRHLKNDDELAAIPVIVVSADATAERMREALTLGAARYVTKPVELRGFLAAVDEVLASADSRWLP